MALIIEIKNQQKKIPLPSRRITKTVREILKHAKVSRVNLSLVFVSDKKIHSLNKQYLHHDYPTDVLAFDYTGHKGIPRNRLAIPGTKSWESNGFRRAKSQSHTKKFLNGEIIISTEMAFRNAKRFQTSPYQELVLYVIHGILHLIGYDDGKSADIQRMRKKEQQILNRLKLKR